MEEGKCWCSSCLQEVPCGKGDLQKSGRKTGPDRVRVPWNFLLRRGSKERPCPMTAKESHRYPRPREPQSQRPIGGEPWQPGKDLWGVEDTREEGTQLFLARQAWLGRSTISENPFRAFVWETMPVTLPWSP